MTDHEKTADREPARGPSPAFPNEDWVWEAAIEQAEAEMRLPPRDKGGADRDGKRTAPILSKSTTEGIAPSLKDAVRQAVAEYEIPEELIPILKAEMKRCAARALETMDPAQLDKLIAAGRRVEAVKNGPTRNAEEKSVE